MTNEENKNALKHLFGRDCLLRISQSIQQVHPHFDSKKFLSILPELTQLEMKPRVRFIRSALKDLLPQSYEKALIILLKSIKSGHLKDFDIWPYTDFVQTHGLEELELSLNALKAMTPYFTSEWAIRPFLKKYPNEAMQFLLKCSKDPNSHVRRWSSEGSRPRLPWGERLHSFVKDPSPSLPLLENLKHDSELYVRKSVANHLNDITKDNPDVALKILTRWKRKAPPQHQAHIDWIIRHSLRSLIKEGDKKALAMIGISIQPKLKVNNFRIHSKKISLGKKLDFQFEVLSQSSNNQKLVIDYIIHFVKANQSTSPKVFKLKNMELSPKKSFLVSKTHSLKPVTTRRYYSGQHYLEIQINGKSYGRQAWLLKV